MTEYSQLPYDSPIHEYIKVPYSANPFSPSALRIFRLCVPDQWYRRPPRNGIKPLESNLDHLQAPDESDEESEDEGTAKLAKTSQHVPLPHPSVASTGTSTRSRLSSLFEGWSRSTPPSSPDRKIASLASEYRKSVSEPIPVENRVAAGVRDARSSEELGEEFSPSDFENMLVWYSRLFLEICMA